MNGTNTCNSSPGGSMGFGMESQRCCVSRCGGNWHRDGAAQAAAVGAAVPLLRCICRVIGRPEAECGASTQRRLACSKSTHCGRRDDNSHHNKGSKRYTSIQRVSHTSSQSKERCASTQPKGAYTFPTVKGVAHLTAIGRTVGLITVQTKSM